MNNSTVFDGQKQAAAETKAPRAQRYNPRPRRLYKRNGKGLTTKQRSPLTGDQQELAAHAWRIVQTIIARYEQKRKGPDYAGFVAERITVTIPSYDPRLSSLKTWACRQATGACLDAMRGNVLVGPARPVDRESRPHVMLFSTHQANNAKRSRRRSDWDGSNDILFTRAVATDSPEWLQMDSLADLLRGSSEIEVQIILGYYRDGLTMREIGERIDRSETVVSLRHKAILARLRDRLGDRMPAA